ncbi:MAG: PHB depolymerase family esterase, partial [Gammaproteobacteria bacterium]|nr:PHB depolymerase family esterase [Gammaproteobacteria bacterium]
MNRWLSCSRAGAWAVWLLLGVLPREVLADAAGLTGDRVGEVRYGVYLPRQSAAGAPLPLLVVLHGCRQSAAEMRALTGFDGLAEKHGFVVAYAEIGASPTNPLGCWTWWLPANLSRGHGVPADLVGVVARVAQSTPLDTTRVYVAGFSSGAAMALVAAALYPDVFAAAGVHSGLPFGAAGAWTCATRVMEEGDETAAARALDVLGARGAR